MQIDPRRVVGVLRPPPSVTLYHRVENPLFDEVVAGLAAKRNVTLVITPRTDEQRAPLPELGHENVIVPEKAVDGLSLIAAADFVIGAGGTMNREAVALGTPAYTMFAGRLGAVDEKLIAEGRLRRAYAADDVTRQEEGHAHVVAAEPRDPQMFVDEILAVARRRWARGARGAGDMMPERVSGEAFPLRGTGLQAIPEARVRDRLFVSRHRIWQLVTDAVLASAALYLAYLLRFNFELPRRLPPPVPLDLGVRRRGRAALLHRARPLQQVVAVLGRARPRRASSWRRPSAAPSAWSSASSSRAGCRATSTVPGTTCITADRIPLSVIVLNWFLLFLFMGGARLVSRLYWERPWRQELSRDRKKVLVVGAGDAGELVVREMLKSDKIRYRPVGFVDDDPKKKNLRIHNVRVVGTTRRLPQLIEEYSVEEVIIAMPSVSGRAIEQIVLSCKKANAPVKTLPGVYELIKGSVTIEQLRDVQVEDVLGRPEVSVDYNSLGGYLEDRVVLVTGAGGSIGGELCRQIAAMGPRQLLMVDHSEAALFEILHELETERHATGLVPLLVDIKDKRKLRDVFAARRPEVVFHAAAYKHVPMMELNPAEAFDNNTFATMNLVEDAVRFGADRVVSISTDKAVEPTTVMGLSKAVAERVVETLARTAGDTKLMCVRFGNVLGLERQRGADLQAPDRRRRTGHGDRPEMTRFFMTIPEAVRLVLQAGSHGRGRRDLRARHGRAGAHRRHGARDDPPLGPRARPRHRDRLHRRATRREARTRSSSTRAKRSCRPTTPRSRWRCAGRCRAASSNRSSPRSATRCSRTTSKRPCASRTASPWSRRVRSRRPVRRRRRRPSRPRSRPRRRPPAAPHRPASSTSPSATMRAATAARVLAPRRARPRRSRQRRSRRKRRPRRDSRPRRPPCPL